MHVLLNVVKIMLTKAFLANFLRKVAKNYEGFSQNFSPNSFSANCAKI